MKQSVWDEEYDITSYLVDFQKKLSLYGLLNLLQETAWRHAAHLGHGYKETRQVGTSWVLVRQRVEMTRWPDWEDRLAIRTWLRPPSTVVVTRDFELTVAGREVGRAAAHWLTIDHKTRRPSPLPFPKDSSLFRQDGQLDIDPDKIPMKPGLQPLASFEVRTSDLDMNGHVNNTGFAQWVLDSLPLSAHESHTLKSYQINFLAEAHHLDRVNILAPPTQSEHFFYGQRASDQKLLFAARLEG